MCSSHWMYCMVRYLYPWSSLLEREVGSRVLICTQTGLFGFSFPLLGEDVNASSPSLGPQSKPSLMWRHSSRNDSMPTHLTSSNEKIGVTTPKFDSMVAWSAPENPSCWQTSDAWKCENAVALEKCGNLVHVVKLQTLSMIVWPTRERWLFKWKFPSKYVNNTFQILVLNPNQSDGDY